MGFGRNDHTNSSRSHHRDHLRYLRRCCCIISVEYSSSLKNNNTNSSGNFNSVTHLGIYTLHTGLRAFPYLC